MQLRSIHLSTGVTLPYVEHGDPSGVPVILLHGVTDSWHSFELVLPHLPEPVRAFALTQRGHGDGDRPASYRTHDFAADVAAFMDALGLERAVIAGHSMGSSNAIRFGIEYPSRVLGLVLVGTFAGYKHNTAIAEFWQSTVSQLADPVPPDVAREFQQSTLAQPVPPAFFELAVQESLKVPARVWRAVFQGLLEDDFAAALGRIAAPTLIVWGTRDAFCSQGDQEILVKTIEGSRLLVYDQAGHALHWEEPERFAADLSAFVEGLGGPH